MSSSDLLLGFLILILFVYVLMMCIDKKLSTNDCAIIAFALVLLLVAYFTYMIRKEGGRKHTSEGFTAELDYKMGAYTGLDVTKDSMPYDGLTSEQLAAPEKVLYHSPVGSSHNLRPDKYGYCHLPSTDGTKMGPKALSMFAYNKSKPECCDRSSYSTSTGCVCITDNQRKYMAKGGKLLDSNNMLPSGNPMH